MTASFHSQRARELPALLFALIWVVGVEVRPLYHQAFHASLGAHSHSRSHEHDAFGNDVDGDEDSPTNHGAGSLEHHDLATLVPQLVVAPTPVFRRIEVLETEGQARAAASSVICPYDARGPPPV